MVAAAGPHEAERGALEPVYIWDAVVRGTHWLIVFSMLVLALTGVYLGRPFVTAPGPANVQFVTGWVRVVHFYAAIVFSLAVLARIAWMFVGPRRSGWRQFVPTSRHRIRDLFEDAKFYAFLRPAPPPGVGHSPLAGASYAGVFVLYLVMIATGMALYAVSSHSYMRFFQFLLPLFHGAQGARWLHHVVMWLLVVFVVVHLFMATMVARVERNGTLDSIFSGYKYVGPIARASELARMRGPARRTSPVDKYPRRDRASRGDPDE